MLLGGSARSCSIAHFERVFRTANERAVRLKDGLEVRKPQEERGAYRKIASYHHNEKPSSSAVARAWTSHYLGSHLGLALTGGCGAKRRASMHPERRSTSRMRCWPVITRRHAPVPPPTPLFVPLSPSYFLSPSPFSCDSARIAADAYGHAPSCINLARFT